jgi:hypothetical protein
MCLLVTTHNFVLLQVNNTTYTYSPAQKVLEPNFVVGAPSARLPEAGSQLNCVALPGNLTKSTIGQYLFAYTLWAFESFRTSWSRIFFLSCICSPSFSKIEIPDCFVSLSRKSGSVLLNQGRPLHS